LFIALLTLALSLPGSLGLQGGGTVVLGAAMITAFLTGPFLLALIALRWFSSATAKVTWLLCGLVALGVGVVLLASGVGFFLAVAGIGLIAAWWMSRCGEATLASPQARIWHFFG
jgi:hypothetical protein